MKRVGRDKKLQLVLNDITNAVPNGLKKRGS